MLVGRFATEVLAVAVAEGAVAERTAAAAAPFARKQWASDQAEAPQQCYPSAQLLQAVAAAASGRACESDYPADPAAAFASPLHPLVLHPPERWSNPLAVPVAFARQLLLRLITESFWQPALLRPKEGGALGGAASRGKGRLHPHPWASDPKAPAPSVLSVCVCVFIYIHVCVCVCACFVSACVWIMRHGLKLNDVLTSCQLFEKWTNLGLILSLSSGGDVGNGLFTNQRGLCNCTEL